MRCFHPYAIAGTLAFLGIGGAAALGGLGCGDDIGMYGPASGCAIDAGCGINSSGGGPAPDGGGTTTSSSSGTGGSVAVGELRGDVEQFADATFLTTTGSPVQGAINILLSPASGPQINVPYGGSNGTTFDVMSVPSGAGWVSVQDQSQGANGIWSTITPLTLPQLGTVVLPVVSQSTFTNLAGSLPTVQLAGVSMQAAQIVLLLQYNGQPFSGVSVTSGAGGAIVAYDVGPGVYSDQATTTSSGGTIILFNAGGSGMATIGITNTTLMKSYTLTVPATNGAVTVAGFNLD
jgi:hypothetical protein